MAASDEALMERVAGGDLGAFGELFDRHQPAVFAFLCRFFGEAATAEDVVQEAFWRVWQQRARFDRSRRFVPWLYTLARRLALNEVKKPYRRIVRMSELGDEVTNDVHADGSERRIGLPDEALRAASLREEVREALQSLPPDQRFCLILREFDGYSFREIAEIMGCTEGNARVIAHRARCALRERLRPLLECEGSCV
jgi:RNA polymerase sigma-70 factor (ECF subfamily)